MLFLLFLSALAAAQTDLAAASHQAKELMAAGRYDEAVPIYQKLVAAVPDNPGLILNLGLAEEMGGHPAQAIPHFQTVLRAQPDNVPALTSLGTSALQTNQPRLAIPPLEKLLTLQPEDANARGMLAGAYLTLDRPEEAANQYRKITDVDATDPKAWYGLGKAYEASAARAFDQLAKAAPQSAYVAALLADSRYQRKQYRSAFFFYHQAQSKLPDLPGLHIGLSHVYGSTGHADWAATERAAEQKLPPSNCSVPTAECHFLKGDFLAAAKSPGAKPETLFWTTRAYNQLAVNAFDRLGHLPESVEIHALKAQILHGHAQDAEAVAEWRKALALAPDNPRLETELASSLVQARNYDQAIPLLTKLHSHEPNAPDLNFLLGESYWRTQQPEKAVPFLTAALQADPQLLPAHAALGMVYATLNQNAQAVPHLVKAVTLDDDGSLHYSLARAYQASGNTAQATKAMAEYQQIKKKNQQVDDELAQQSAIVPPPVR